METQQKVRFPAVRGAMSGAALVCLLGVLGACSTVDTDQTIPAFATAAAAGKTSFATAQAAESKAFAAAALDAALSNGKVETADCWSVVADTTKCRLVVTANGTVVDTSPVALNGLKLASALADYGSALQTYATAKELADRQAAEEKLATSLGGAGVPGAAAVGTLLATIQRDAALQGRRTQLKAIVRDADPTIQSIADLLQTEAEKLQANVVKQNANAVSHEEVLLAVAPAANKRDAADALISAIDAEHAAANAKLDLASTIKKAHAAMLASLENPSLNAKQAITQIGELEKDFEAVKGAFGTPAPAKEPK